MPKIPLLEPTLLVGVIRELDVAENLTLLRQTPRRPWAYPTASWDVEYGSLAVARLNVPDAEAHVVPKSGRSTKSHGWMTLREKKLFSPHTLNTMRQLGTLSTVVDVEREIVREFADLNARFDRFAEFALWQALTGRIVMDFEDSPVDIDFGMRPSHKPTVSTSWATATPSQIADDISAWKRVIARDSGLAPTAAYFADTTGDLIVRSFIENGDDPAGLMSDRLKDAWFQTGTLPNFMGMNWQPQTQVYDASGNAYNGQARDPEAMTRYLSEGAIVMGNFETGRPIELLEGVPDDFRAIRGNVRPTGKFAKTFEEEDPSGLQRLLHWKMFPALLRPDQFVYVADVTPA